MGKNKRNKGKTKAPGANSNGGPLIFEDNNVSTLEQNQEKQNSGDTESQQTGVSESDVDLDKQALDDDKQNVLPEVEGKEYLLNRKSELEEKVKSLQEHVDQCLKKEAWLNVRLEQLQSETNTWMLKEVHLNERIKALEDDNDSWTLKQGYNEEMIHKLNGTIAELQTKVDELGESRDLFSQENQQLMSKISLLESHVQKLEEVIIMGSLANRSTEILPEYKDAVRKTKSSSELVVRGAEDSQEVNRSYEEPNQESTNSGDNLIVEFESSKEIRDVAPSNHMSALYSSANVLEMISMDPLNEASAIILPASADQGGSQEIVPCQLDEIEIQEVDSRPAVHNETEETVPITDAPLIGAPFRLFSFVAKYVSGADLVKENARTSRT